VQTIQTARHAKLVQLLIAERKRAGLRQVDVAKRLRQTQWWVAHIESGQRRIDVIEFLALAKAIGFDPFQALRRIARVKG
jgi:transcriptional regulator with XRE-family HTH domain